MFLRTAEIGKVILQEEMENGRVLNKVDDILFRAHMQFITFILLVNYTGVFMLQLYHRNCFHDLRIFRVMSSFQICSLCVLNIVLLHALSIKNELELNYRFHMKNLTNFLAGGLSLSPDPTPSIHRTSKCNNAYASPTPATKILATPL